MSILVGLAHEYKYINGKLYSFDIEGGGDDPNHGYGKIEYAIEEKNSIYIYEKYAYTRYDFSENDVNYYTSSNSKEKIKFKNDIINTTKEIFDSLYEDLYMYKHTFKKDNETGEYYWISTERYIEN